MESSSTFMSDLILAKGSWAAYFFFDDAISRLINQKQHDFELAKRIKFSATDSKSVELMKRFETLVGVELKVGPTHDYFPARSLIDFNDVRLNSNIFDPKYWLQRLRQHLGRRDFSHILDEILLKEAMPGMQPVLRDLQDWSFPILEKLLPLTDNGHPVNFHRTVIATLSEKKWFQTRTNTPTWIEGSDFRNMSRSQYLVWKLIHEGTHLLHLQNYPTAGHLYDPSWRLQMEAVAMVAELRFLNYILDGGEIEEGIGFPVCRKNVVSVLLSGFLERSLRLQCDIFINQHDMAEKTCIAYASSEFGISPQFFGFIEKFKAMPGFMGGYMLGLKRYLDADDETEILSNTNKLFTLWNS